MHSTQSTYIFSSTISLNLMISLVTEIEAEVYASPIYCHALATLEKKSQKRNTDSLLKKVTRSVIRVAFQRFLTIPEFHRQSLTTQPGELSNPSLNNPETAQMTSDNLNSVKVESPVESTIESPVESTIESPVESTIESPVESTIESPVESPVEETQALLDPASPQVADAIAESPELKRKTKLHDFLEEAKELGTKITHYLENISEGNSVNHQKIDAKSLKIDLQQAQQQRLQDIGRQIRAARLAKSISIAQLNVKTAILSSKIEAIENGCLEKLPEPIYLQGYIRRLGQAVGLDGDRLANYFLNTPPHPGGNINIKIPGNSHSYREQTQPKIYLNYMHLIWVYISLIASAFGMLHFIDNQSDASTNLPEDKQKNMEYLPINPNPEKCQQKSSPELIAPEKNITANLSISPPETL
ncbi:helix-turn-helix domain-containing protein [Planktothricoides raciborskii]|uniref:Helix-turn-helix domain-containing protein n=1 Tax=Planktothricoides raciborskii GIHE-MW2 TaxID=2792601 RepID=A0AAU8JG81_9CYAN